MSADNWGICPKCKKEDDNNYQKKVANLEKQYGKIPADEYIEKFNRIQVRQDIEESLREDYQISINEDGVFDVRYSAYCDRCKFTFTYNYTTVVEF